MDASTVDAIAALFVHGRDVVVIGDGAQRFPPVGQGRARVAAAVGGQALDVGM